MIRVGIVGTTGYAGIGITALLLRHPEAELVWATSETFAGKPLDQVYPFLKGRVDLRCSRLNIPTQARQADIVFVAAPKGVAMKMVPQFLERGVRVIDLGGDFRFRNPAHYKVWYGAKHVHPFWSRRAVYGLTELHYRRIESARLVANPGCYAASAILALAPLAQAKLLQSEPVVVDAKSGVSGAGRGLTIETHFPEADAGVSAYGVTNHRHTGEMEQEISALAGHSVPFAFTPHLIPMTRGILTTSYVRLRKNLTLPKLNDLYRTFYRRANFVRIQEGVARPSTKHTFGTNFCDIHLVVDKRLKRLVIVSTLDNLLKGASGQAIQNMNVMFGLDERTGLELPGLYP